jgi:raffinose/stachyose/melibiose transport system permease protein
MKIKKIWLVAFLAPATALFAFIYATPLGILFSTSFTRWIVASSPQFNGLHNYIQLFFNDSRYIQAVVNTVVWMLLQSTIHVVIGVLLALILARKKFYWKFTRTVYMFPNIISSAAIGMMFVMFLNPSFGAVNMALEALGFTNVPNFFMDTRTAFGTVTMMWLPFAATITLLVMAEMTSIDPDLFAAAKIDGANEFQTNIYIVLPLMKNIIGTCTILAATSMLHKLDIIMMTTRGGPGARTLNLPIYVYETSFTSSNFGMGNAIGVTMILLGLAVVAIINRIFGMNNRDK